MRRLFTLFAAMALVLAVLATPAMADRDHRDDDRLSEAGPGDHVSDDRSQDRTMAIAVIGDVPYGPAQVANFGMLADDVNAAPDVSVVVHVGDIKDGGSVCSDEYFEFIRKEFEKFADPLFYTPGDNEWTDCHRDSNGDYNPVERLDAIRDVFFDHPGKSLSDGRHKRAKTQKKEGFPENIRWRDNGVQFGLIHVVGSNNGMEPWLLGADDHDLPAQRIAEVEARTAAAVEWIDEIFDDAEKHDTAGVMIAWQADTWAVFEHSGGDDMSGFAPIIHRLAERAREFEKPVLLVTGDSHDYYTWHPLSDIDTHPLAPFYTWRGTDLSTYTSADYYGVGGDIDNLTQVVFEVWDRFSPEPAGFGPEDFGWLEVTVDPDNEGVFSVTQHFVDAPTP